MYIAPGQWQTSPRGQNFDVNRKALSLYPFAASFKNLFEVYYTILYNHVYSPRAGGILPRGDKILMSTEICCHFGHLLQVSNHRQGRYYRENKWPQKCNTSIIANGTSQRNAKIYRHKLTCHLQKAIINSREIKQLYSNSVINSQNFAKS